MRTAGALTLLSDYMKLGASRFPDKHAFIFGEQRVTYKEFELIVARLARYLISIGVNKGDRIAYIMTPRPEFFYLYMAAARIGAIIVGMSTRHTAHEMEYILNNSEAGYVFTLSSMYDIDYQQRLGQILPVCPTVKKVVVIGGSPVLAETSSFADIISQDYGEWEQPLLERERSLTTDDGLIIVYTSGSTGQPKGALMSHKNIIHMSLVELAQCGAGPDDIWINHLPVNHVSGATEVGATVIVGNAAMVLEPFNPIRTLELIEKEKITILGQVPTMFAMEFALPDYGKYDLSSLKTVVISGAMAPEETLAQMISTMCPNCYNCLGLTEVSGLITYTDPGAGIETLNKTVGRVAPEFEMNLVDKNRQPVADGETGEIAYRGTSVIKEYYKLPEATAAAIDADGWFYSGDLGYTDEDGNLRMVGRSKEMYITGGFNVYPAEVEEYIMRYPGVLMAACVAMPDPIKGEVGRAYVVPKPGFELEGDKIKAFLQEYLADYKLPVQYVIRDMLPMTLLGKIEKKLLRQEIDQEFAGK
ncbi:MAG TPA: class I adenylate-forming enzyme family protein [Syntrophomonadaceae bacterium]|nr:class I adenylate-forming enzyme family protein [Syntrophomonadaceae bacterium]